MSRPQERGTISKRYIPWIWRYLQKGKERQFKEYSVTGGRVECLSELCVAVDDLPREEFFKGPITEPRQLSLGELRRYSKDLLQPVLSYIKKDFRRFRTLPLLNTQGAHSGALLRSYSLCCATRACLPARRLRCALLKPAA